MDLSGLNWPFDEQQRHDLTITGKEFVLHELRGTIRLDPGQPAHFMDMIMGEGDPSPCFYEFDGKRLQISMADPGSPRPKSLTPDPGQQVIVFTFER